MILQPSLILLLLLTMDIQVLSDDTGNKHYSIRSRRTPKSTPGMGTRGGREGGTYLGS